MFTNNEKKQFAKFHFAGGVLHGEIVSVDGDIYTIIEKDGTKHKVKKEKIIQIYWNKILPHPYNKYNY